MTTSTRTSFCLFQDPWWLNLTTEGHWDEAVIANGEGTIARLPYRKINRFGATVLTQPRLTPYLGTWLRPSTGKASNQFSERRKLTTELLAQLPKHDLFSQNLWPGIPDWLPFHWAGFSQQTYYTNWHTDLSDTASVWNSFLDVTRNEIRKAQKRVEVVVSNDVEQLCLLHESSFARKGLKPPRERAFLRKVLEGALSAGHGRISIAQDEQGNAHAGAFLVFDDRTTHYLIGGSDVRHRSSGAASLLVWDAIQFAAVKSRIFDFEGSMNEGVSRFFRGFNPQLVAISHIYRVSRRGKLGAALYDAGAALLGRPPLRL